MYYEIQNDTKSKIVVSYIKSTTDTNKTTITIPAGHGQIIYRERGIGYSNMLYDRLDSVDLHYINIQSAFLPDKRNYKDKKNWEFKKISDGEGWCILTFK